MRQLPLFALTMSALSVLAQPVRAQAQPEDPIAAIRARYAEEDEHSRDTERWRQWLQRNRAPGFTLVNWVIDTTRVLVVSVADFDRRSEPHPSTIDWRYSSGVRNALVRGDSIDALVLREQIAVVRDSAGERTRRFVGRRLDTWIRQGDRWALLRRQIIGDEQYTDGRLIRRDGRRVDGAQVSAPAAPHRH